MTADDVDLGSISTEIRHEHIWMMGIDRPSKYNGFTPEMMTELGDAYTRLDEDDELWVGVLHAHGDHFTAGLDLPRFKDRMAKGGPAGDRGAGNRRRLESGVSRRRARA